MFMECVIVVMASVLIVGGVATLGGGWLPAWYRSDVCRPVMFGWAQLTIASACIINLLSHYRTNTPRLGVGGIGFVVMMLGGLLAGLSEKPRRR
ncbi:hypothetical protein AB8A21_20620 [Streptomyces sp. BF23-18]|uniref:hypothetical protein n=1 Tax=Streptomyces sp. BF23-18 TaxID=3240282 RepID=UPI0034E386A7